MTLIEAGKPVKFVLIVIFGYECAGVTTFKPLLGQRMLCVYSPELLLYLDKFVLVLL